MTPLTTEATGRIITAVGKCGTPLSTIDRSALRDDLEWAATLYATSAQIRVGKGKHVKALQQVTKTARKLKLLLADAEIWRTIGRQYPFDAPDPDVILEHLIKSADRALAPSPPEPEWQRKAAHQMTQELALHEKSTFEWLAGERLPLVFTKHFDCRETLSRVLDGRLDSPFIRFAESALIELGIQHNRVAYTRETVARALTIARTGRNRR
jgi:hypothetical protein